MQLDDWVLCRVRKKGVAFAPETDDTSEAPSHAAAPATDYHAGKEGEAAPWEVQVPNAACDSFGDDLTDGQLLQYLVGSGSGQDADGAVGGVASTGGHQGCGESAPHALVSVLETIKRNLSFQAIDDMYLLQPASKRANCMRGAGVDDEQLSPATSLSISEVDEVL